MGDQRHVVRFLDRVARQHGETGLAAGHNVAVITEDVQRVVRQGAGADMEDRGRQFAGDLIHVGDHQQQALGRGEGGGQRAGGQGAVHSAGSTGFGLHLGDFDRLAEQVLPVMGGPLVRDFRHGGRRGDGVDGCHIAERIRNVADSSIAVNGQFDGHELTS